MIKKNLKFLLSIILVISLLTTFSVCFADEENEVTNNDNLLVSTSGDENSDETSESSETEEAEVYSDDLYLMGANVTMDKLVDGNVYILGNDVKITGKINGNLFVLANSLSFEEESYVQYSVFACANSIYYNGASYDLYALASDKLEMTFNSYVIRDLRALSSEIILKSAIGRNANLVATNLLDFGADEDIPVVYGNLNYSAKSEIDIPEGVLAGEKSNSNFTPIAVSNNNQGVSNIIIGFVISVVTALVIALIVKYCLPSVNNKIAKFNYSPINILKCFGIGLLILVCLAIIAVLLMISEIGIKLGIILVTISVFIYFVSGPLFIISITDILKAKLNVEKSYVYYLLIALVSLVLHAIALIPVAGGIIIFIIISTVVGLYFQTLPKINNKKSEENKENI